ncbi:MAG: HNH endonuclease signature motif containing protein [Alphaproteobacteria bacterium]|nr:HNH endonuclease signature motif containing protein [Alphaproteobacteria bacterium]
MAKKVHLKRNQNEAKKIVKDAHPFPCCVICGLQLKACLTVAHLDQNPENNDPDNLALMCLTHHWMFDAKLYPLEAIKLLRKHWQECMGEPDHSARMKGAGARAAATRKSISAALRAARTRKLNAIEKQLITEPKNPSEASDLQ